MSLKGETRDLCRDEGALRDVLWFRTGRVNSVWVVNEMVNVKVKSKRERQVACSPPRPSLPVYGRKFAVYVASVIHSIKVRPKPRSHGSCKKVGLLGFLLP